MRLFLFGLLLMSTAQAEESRSQEETNPPLQVSLVSEVTAIQPGTPFTVGLFLQHAPDHHSYWRYPGIVGVPTQIRWNLPAGFTAGPIQWPTPKRVDMRGYEAHGYNKDTLLMVEITPPSTLNTPTVRLSGNASWMCCSQKQCHPGYAEIESILPVVTSDAAPSWNPDWRKRFEKTRSQRPGPLRSWKIQVAQADPKTIRLHLRPQSPEVPPLVDPYFFSTNGLIASNETQRLEAATDGVILHLVRNPFAEKGLNRVEGLLVHSGRWSKSGEKAAGKARRLSCPLPPGEKKPSEGLQ
ncbi:MAG: protein-disulfide reductase DsbD domain-containing protein [Verrucomicrobiota bacterium]